MCALNHDEAGHRDHCQHQRADDEDLAPPEHRTFRHREHQGRHSGGRKDPAGHIDVDGLAPRAVMGQQKGRH